MTLYLPSRRQVDDGLDDRAYGPTSAHSELSLLQGYGAPIAGAARVDRVVEAQACSCGGVIDPGVASEIPAAVAAHNDTPQHLAWRARMAIQ